MSGGSRDRRISELSRSLRGFVSGLRDRVSDRRDRFLLLIASDLIAQLEAEATRGHEIDQAWPAPRSELCARIRSGACDLDQLRTELLRVAAIELEITRPHFDRAIDLP